MQDAPLWAVKAVDEGWARFMRRAFSVEIPSDGVTNKYSPDAEGTRWLIVSLHYTRLLDGQDTVVYDRDVEVVRRLSGTGNVTDEMVAGIVDDPQPVFITASQTSPITLDFKNDSGATRTLEFVFRLLRFGDDTKLDAFLDWLSNWTEPNPLTDVRLVEDTTGPPPEPQDGEPEPDLTGVIR